MKAAKFEKLSLQAIADIVRRSGDVRSARESLSAAKGLLLSVSGKVLKVVKRDGQCKLVIEPGDVPGFVVFADCLPDAKRVRERKVRKSSWVVLRGKLQSFGSSAICLTECRLQLPLVTSRKSDKTVSKLRRTLTKTAFGEVVRCP